MTKNARQDLFAQVVEDAKLNPGFQTLLLPHSEPCRAMMREMFSTFEDSDGNFLEQFQSTGFDSRTWELYLHAYLASAGFSAAKRYDRPDFIVTKGGESVCIEAV